MSKNYRVEVQETYQRVFHEVNAESDKIERENAEKLNSADSLVFQTEKFVSENADKLSTDDKASLEEKIQNNETRE